MHKFQAVFASFVVSMQLFFAAFEIKVTYEVALVCAVIWAISGIINWIAPSHI